MSAPHDRPHAQPDRTAAPTPLRPPSPGDTPAGDRLRAARATSIRSWPSTPITACPALARRRTGRRSARCLRRWRPALRALPARDPAVRSRDLTPVHTSSHAPVPAPICLVRRAFTMLATTLACSAVVIATPLRAAAAPLASSRAAAAARCCRGGGHSRSSGSGRAYYGGGHHSGSHGGSYSGGHGSSHKGGHYHNRSGGSHYGRHKP